MGNQSRGQKQRIHYSEGRVTQEITPLFRESIEAPENRFDFVTDAADPYQQHIFMTQNSEWKNITGLRIDPGASCSSGEEG
jgi:hypothetical protein